MHVGQLVSQPAIVVSSRRRPQRARCTVRMLSPFMKHACIHACMHAVRMRLAQVEASPRRCAHSSKGC